VIARPPAIDLETIPFTTSDEIDLQIRHAAAPRDKAKGRHVVLIHGASAASATFLVPNEASLARTLCEEGFDVWLLDWRGSHLVSDKYLRRRRPGCLDVQPPDAKKYTQRFWIDRVAEIDFPQALTKIRQLAGAESLDVVAHCLGSGAFAQSIAGGHLQELRLAHVVFTTLGLFYEVTFDNAMKAKDFVLERIAADGYDYIAPDQTPWPDALEKDFGLWRKMLSPGCAPLPDIDLCRRLCFMYGIPYFHEELNKELHDPAALRMQFGPIPIEMYIQAGQNVRRRWAAPYGESGDCQKYIDDGARKFFEGKQITLITGTRNTLWHRDSIDRMYEWLRRGGRVRGPQTPEGPAGSVEKIIFRGFGHQDLLWGKRAPQIVFPQIVRALKK